MTVKVAGRGPEVNGVATLFLVLSTIAIVLRCYCRAFVVKSFGSDDWTALVAWVFFVFFCGFAITGVSHGTGQHAVNILPPTEIPIGLKWWWACEPVYVLSNMALKLSIAIFLLRISISRVHTFIIWTVVVVVEVYGAFYFFLFILQCRPSNYFWTQYTGGKGTCIDPRITVDATYGYSAISCVADWTLGLLPIFLVWNLQMNPRTKVVVAMILAVGAIASTATIIRIPYVKDLANQADFLYATTDVALWSLTETGIGITASCCATLRPLFRTFFNRSQLFGSSSPTPSKPLSNPFSPSNSNSNQLRSGKLKAGKIEWGSRGGGYQRQHSEGEDFGDEEMGIGLRSDIGGARGVMTVIGTGGGYGEEGKGGKEWDNSASKLRDSSDEEHGSWRRGIRKTTVTEIGG